MRGGSGCPVRHPTSPMTPSRHTTSCRGTRDAPSAVCVAQGRRSASNRSSAVSRTAVSHTGSVSCPTIVTQAQLSDKHSQPSSVSLVKIDHRVSRLPHAILLQAGQDLRPTDPISKLHTRGIINSRANRAGSLVPSLSQFQSVAMVKLLCSFIQALSLDCVSPALRHPKPPDVLMTSPPDVAGRVMTPPDRGGTASYKEFSVLDVQSTV